jgi:hypothetical protein
MRRSSGPSDGPGIPKPGLRVRFVPYERYKRAGFASIVADLEQGAIILIDARLGPDEEARIITGAMKSVSETFSGVEMGSLDFLGEAGGRAGRLRSALAERVAGRRRGATVIGPARVVQRIRRDPEGLLLYM